ncbi:MAG: DUF1622 domain-containing protein [Candidatus Aminicenantaceae bacterium]
MNIIHDILEIIILVISGLGALVVAWGVGEAIKSFAVNKFKTGEKSGVSANEEIRQHLGSHLLLGLEIFIGADIISTVVSPSWEKAGILSIIVVIRTILSYFLRMELSQGHP